MTQSEFLDKLREALSNDLNGRAVQENIDYYRSYIMGEINKGKTEEIVIGELGDPWVIARTLIETAESTQDSQGNYTSYETVNRQGESGQNSYSGNNRLRIFAFDTWWKKLLLVLGIIGALLIVIAVIGGIFSLLVPIIVPVLIVMFVIRLIGNTRR